MRRQLDVPHLAGGSRRTWTAITASSLALLLASWLLLIPLLGGTDEAQHAIASYADAHLITHRPSPYSYQPAVQAIREPGTFAFLPAESYCLALGRTANCRVPIDLCAFFEHSNRCNEPLIGSNRPSAAMTYTARYPPTYFSLVGLPTFVSTSPGVLYAMRMVAAIINGLLLFGALFAVFRWGRRPGLIAGLAVALAPSVLALSVVINPSGLEVCAALCAWTAGILLATTGGPPPLALTRMTGLGATALALSRPSSPAWLALIVIVVGLIARPSRRRELLADTHLRRWGLIALVATIFTMTWVVLVHSGEVLTTIGYRTRSNGQNMIMTLRMSETWLHQTIGLLGRTLFYVPTTTLMLWSAAGLALIVAGLLGCRGAHRGRKLALPFIMVVTLAVPYGLSLLWHQNPEFIDSGRYGLPAAVGIALVAGGLMPSTRTMTRLTVGIIVACGIGEVVAFAGMLNLFSHGTRALPWKGGTLGTWSPPVSGVSLLIVSTFAMAGLSASFVHWVLASFNAERQEPSNA